MGHHYLPQFYLRGFADGNTVWVHDRKGHRSFPSQPKSIANENKFYTDEIERYFANEVEGPAESAIAALRARQGLDSSQRGALAHYVLALWMRVPEGRERVNAGVPEVAESIRKEWHAELDGIMATAPEWASLAEALKVGSEIIEKFKTEPPPEVWHQYLDRESRSKAAAVLLSMNWQLLLSPQAEFLTSDNPVFFFQHDGIDTPKSELTIPISSSVLLWAHRQPTRGTLYLEAPREAIRVLNRRVASNATRFVFSRRNEPWMLPFACKRDHALTRLVAQ
jgi:hypothetical protein